MLQSERHQHSSQLVYCVLNITSFILVTIAALKASIWSLFGSGFGSGLELKTFERIPCATLLSLQIHLPIQPTTCIWFRHFCYNVYFALFFNLFSSWTVSPHACHAVMLWFMQVVVCYLYWFHHFLSLLELVSVLTWCGLNMVCLVLIWSWSCSLLGLDTQKLDGVLVSVND